MITEPWIERRVNDALSKLIPREEKILQMRFGLNGEVEHTMKQIGQWLGVTPGRVGEIMTRSLRRLRSLSSDRWN